MGYEDMKAQGPVRNAVLASGEAPTHHRADFKNWIGWAEAKVPDEHRHLAAMAASMLCYLGEPVTVRAVRARLKATGRNRKSLERAA